MLNSPSNPSGAVYSADELRALAGVLERHPAVWTISDDMYEHVLFDGRTFATLAAVAPQLAGRIFTVNGVSKTYAMTGWRLGYGAGPVELVRAMARLQAQSSLNPSSVSQAAAVAALNGPQDIVRERSAIFEARRDALVRRLVAIPGLACQPPEGAFYVYVSCAGWLGRRTPQGRTLAERRRRDRLAAGSGPRAAERRRLRPVALLPGVVRRGPGAARARLRSPRRRGIDAVVRCDMHVVETVRRLGRGLPQDAASRRRCCTTPSAR